MEKIGEKRWNLKNLIKGNIRKEERIWIDERVGGVKEIKISIDVEEIRIKGRGKRKRGSIRKKEKKSWKEIVRENEMEKGKEGKMKNLNEEDDLRKVDLMNEGWKMWIVGMDGDMKEMKRERIKEDGMKRNWKKEDCKMLKGGEDGVILERIIKGRDWEEKIRNVMKKVEKIIGIEGNGRKEKGKMIERIEIEFEVERKIIDELKIGKRSEEEFNKDERNLRLSKDI